MIKITHLTSAHPRYDTRIFIKECGSLAKLKNYEVNLIVADGLGNKNKNSVNIFYYYELKEIFDKLWLVNSFYKKSIKDIFSKYFLYDILALIDKWLLLFTYKVKYGK